MLPCSFCILRFHIIEINLTGTLSDSILVDYLLIETFELDFTEGVSDINEGKFEILIIKKVSHVHLGFIQKIYL
jgi:hypothetical protein